MLDKKNAFFKEYKKKFVTGVKWWLLGFFVCLIIPFVAHRLYRTQSIQIAVDTPPISIVIDNTIDANSPDPCLIFGAKCAGTPNFVNSTTGIDGWISCMFTCSIILSDRYIFEFK